MLEASDFIFPNSYTDSDFSSITVQIRHDQNVNGSNSARFCQSNYLQFWTNFRMQAKNISY